MPVDPAPLIDDLAKAVDDLTVKVKELQATSEKLSDEHAGKFQAALAALKAMLA